LYNPAKLQQSPFCDLLAADNRRVSPAVLSRLLTDAIQAVKPGPDVPVSAHAWRLFHILTYRYVEQSSQKEVAIDLALSVRQLRRLEQDAVQVLADYLRTHGPVESKTRPSPTAQTTDTGPGAPPGRTERDRELAWVQESFPRESANFAEVFDGVLRTIAPLLEATRTQVETSSLQDLNLPPVAGQAATLRQALLSLLTAIAHAAPAGHLTLTIAPRPQDVCVQALAVQGTEGHSATREEVMENLEMTRDLLRLTGGTLITPPHWQPGKTFTATLRLPLAEQVCILVIDDNVDTLQLVQRFLQGSRYRFIGVRDPELALDQALSLSPSLIMLDVMLPGVDGWELLGRVRENPALHKTPVIISTILPQEQLALTLGAAAFLRKPVTQETLLTTLDRLLQGTETE
jgi:CheY-like chemotaxis protein